MNLSQSLITGEGVTITEALSAGGMTTVIGLLIVFSVLAILMLILYLFKFIFYKKPTDVKAVSDVKAPEANAVVKDIGVSTAQDNTDDAEDEDELIAVLTAAVAASLKTSTYNLKIKSYRRIHDNRPAWNKEGLRETIGNRF